MISHAFVNLFGNIAGFVPLGLFLPCLWKRLQSFRYFIVSIVAGIVAIEIIQLFSLRGSCDVDDLILNILGAVLGYGVFKLLRNITTKETEKKENGKPVKSETRIKT